MRATKPPEIVQWFALADALQRFNGLARELGLHVRYTCSTAAPLRVEVLTPHGWHVLSTIDVCHLDHFPHAPPRQRTLGREPSRGPTPEE